MLLLLLKNGQRCSAKETVFGSLPNFCCLGKRSGLNRLDHPDWVKLCVELNCVPNQNTFCYRSLIWELMLYKFKLDYNAAEATKNIWSGKGEGVVDNNTATRWFKKVCFGCKNFTRSSRPKNMDSETGLQAIKANPDSSKKNIWFKFVYKSSYIYICVCVCVCVWCLQ